MVVTLRVLLSQIFAEHIMAGGGKTVTTHTAIITLLVGSLSGAAQSYDDITGTDVRIVNHITAFHTTGYGGIHDDGPYQVAHIGSLTASRIDTHTHLTQFCQQFIRTIDNCRYHLSRNQHLVSSDGAAYQDVVHSTHTEQVVGVHHNRILRNTLPYGEVACFLPIHIGQTGFRASAISMHDIAVFRIASKNIGDDLAECLWEDTLIYVLNGVMYVFFRRTHATHHISVVHLSN